MRKAYWLHNKYIDKIAKGQEDKARKIKKRLEYIREQIRGECISYGEIVELQSMEKYIDKDDVELLQWIRMEE